MRALLAILLIVRSRPGPQLVYCYPSNPARPSPDQAKKDDDSDSDDSDADVNGLANLRRSRSNHKVKPSQESAQTATNDGEARKTSTDQTSSETVLGISEDSLERLLAPGLWSDKKKFEVCLDGLRFVGHPIHAHEDGKWTRKDVRSPHAGNGNATELDDRYGDYTNFGITVTEPQSPIRTTRDFTHIPESLDSQVGRSLGTSMNSVSAASSTETTAASQISMFNIVFAFDDAVENEDESEQVYKYVTRKLSKALHYCQKQSGYVGAEARRILALKARAKQDRVAGDTLSQQILGASELAWAIKEVFDNVTNGNVAGIRLSGQAISLHVPAPTSPSTITEDVPLEPSAGLLLLEDKGTLLRELAHPDASPLAHFIREHTPTKSLSKLAGRMGMSINEVMFLSRHLTKWRKAQPIMALHPRNTYIVHPHAPLDRLADHVNAYARQYPGLPPLPQMLKFLNGGGKSIKYGMLIPSRDHRSAYMEILAWLVRHGFVAQLKTYGWLRRVVHRSPRRERRDDGEARAASQNQNRVPMSVASLLSPQLRAVDDDDSLSVSSERTAIPLNGTQRSRTPVPGPATPRADLDGEEAPDDPWDIIIDPLEDGIDVTNVRNAIEDEELAERLPSLLKYFTGEEALEGIAAKEGYKRESVERWMDALQREGLLTVFKHL